MLTDSEAEDRKENRRLEQERLRAGQSCLVCCDLPIHALKITNLESNNNDRMYNLFTRYCLMS